MYFHCLIFLVLAAWYLVRTMTNIGHVSSWSILFLAGFGIVVNIGSIVILVVKGRNQMFHHMLKIMAVYDLVRILCYFKRLRSKYQKYFLVLFPYIFRSVWIRFNIVWYLWRLKRKEFLPESDPIGNRWRVRKQKFGYIKLSSWKVTMGIEAP